MQKTKLIIGTHGHMPFGTTDEDMERVYRSRYKPFIASLYRYPSVPVVLHYSGVLLAWLERKHPEFFMLLEELINRKQIEIVGGGFYEPMMPLIPLADRLGQIEMLTTFVRKHFGKRPRGCWLPGLMWEQPLAATLQTSGMDYTFLDSRQFLQAGLSGDYIERPCITEDQGKTVAVFPLSVRFSALLSQRDIAEFLRLSSGGAADGGDRILSVLADGLFSGDADEEIAASEASFCALLSALSSGETSVELTTPLRLLKTLRIGSKAYFPSSADADVMYWAMDDGRRRAFDELRALGSDEKSSDAESFFSGAFPRQFLVRYPEANGIYSKMIYIHILINQLRGDKYRKRAAREELWKAQGCDSFWHVKEGGIYRNSLRKSVYAALIDAEKITREKGVFIPSVLPVDFDLDGEKEYLFQGTELNAYISTLGGAAFELDYLPKAWNYLDTFARRKEPYVEEELILDDRPRRAFSERLLHPQIALKDAVSNCFPYSRDCGQERYEETAVDRVHQELTLTKAQATEGPYASIDIIKKYILKKNTLTVVYTLANKGVEPTRFNFATEIDFSFAGETEDLHRVGSGTPNGTNASALSISEYRGIEEFFLEDRKNAVPVSITSNAPYDMWIFPVRTMCRVDDTIGERYQSTCCMPIRPLILAPSEEIEIRYSVRFGK